MEDSVKQSTGIDDPDAMRRLDEMTCYVSGDYNDQATFGRIKEALGGAKRPAHYLAIPAGAVRDRDQRAQGGRPDRQRPRDRRETVRPRPRLRARTQ